VVQREREVQWTGWHAVHGKHKHHVELCRNQGRIADLEIPVLKRAERKVRNRAWQRKRRRQRRDEVIATLRARRRTPADARDWVAVGNNRIAGWLPGTLSTGSRQDPATDTNVMSAADALPVGTRISEARINTQSGACDRKRLIILRPSLDSMLAVFLDNVPCAFPAPDKTARLSVNVRAVPLPWASAHAGR
jgi:hypothetical protein